MKIVVVTLTATCAGALLLACTVPLQRSAAPAAPPVPPAPAAPPATAAQDNRRATLLAEQGRLDAAIAVWAPHAALAQTPAAAYLLRNLGYAYYLKGDYNGALAALGKACLLDPLNARGWRQLGATFEKLGQDERARLMYRQAASLEQHDLQADAALVPGANPALVRAPVPAAAGEEMTVLDAASGVVDLPRMDSADAAAASAVLLEITNGNGIRGLAARTARALDAAGLRVVRLSNAPGFNVAISRVEYEPAFGPAARRLAGQYGAALVPVASCRQANMRLVLGKDATPAPGGAQPHA
jgi:Flp pilus assembly protein TadD